MGQAEKIIHFNFNVKILYQNIVKCLFMHPYLRQIRRRLFSPAKLRVRLVFFSSATVIGLVAAMFALSAQITDRNFHGLYQHYPWLALCLPPIGLATVSWVTLRFFKGAEGSGISQTIICLEQDHQVRKRLLSLKMAFGKIVLTLTSMACGSSLGHQGPTVQVGAAIMYSLHGKRLFRRKNMARALITTGAAAGIAAAFHAPLAGILFAVEEMSRKFENRINSILLTAVIIAGLISIALLGDTPYFGSSHLGSQSHSLNFLHLSGPVLICGLLGGFMGGLFSQFLISTSRALVSVTRTHPVIFALFCGIIVSLVGFLSAGKTFGTGYSEARNLLNGGEASLLFPFYKMLATASSYLSGVPGGLFAPSLSVGAGIGANLQSMFPDIMVSSLVVLGMAGYFTGVVQTPITTFVIVMEMTDSTHLLIPLMATTLLARIVSQLVCTKPLYTSLADLYVKRGQHLNTSPTKEKTNQD